MISITTQFGIIEMPCPDADCGTAIEGRRDHGVPLLTDCPRCYIATEWKILPKLPCSNLVCRDPECGLAHLCSQCDGDHDDCACTKDCLTENAHDFWLERSELTYE